MPPHTSLPPPPGTSTSTPPPPQPPQPQPTPTIPSTTSTLRQRTPLLTRPSAATIKPSSDDTLTPHHDKDKDPNTTPSQQQQQQQQQPSVGKTKDGRAFVVPHTPDMLSSIFDPRQPKTPLDFITIASLSLQLLLYSLLSRSAARWFFLFYFAIWRSAYDAGLGYILKQQSERSWITRTVQQKGWFDPRRNPQSYKWVRSHLETKMEKDYDFQQCPLEYNVWIFFRSIVDVILLNDFVSYSFFAFSCTRMPEGQSFATHIARWVVGWALIAFNLWVKIDAHRVVKDYAWYWGDCFFTITKDLVFDGVYEIAPDPMYSLGYAGYYGLSLVSGSYAVLYVSLAAHFAQYVFMSYFENPHIERTYGQKKPLAARVPLSEAPYNAASASVAAGVTDGTQVALSSRTSPSQSFTSSTASTTDATSVTSEDDEPLSPRVDSNGSMKSRRPSRASHTSLPHPPRRRKITNLHDLHHKLFRKDAVVYKNLDLLRGNDFLLVVGGLYAVVPLLMPSGMGPKTTLALYFSNAIAWRAFHSGALGLLLKAQSESKWMVRHFLKHYNYDDPAEAVFEAFGSFKTIYNASLVMVYTSFALLCWKCYAPLGGDWTVGTDLLRHTLGALLVALHVWAANSSYKVLGPFGWFYGDFFIDEYPHQLYYTGIYRFLNNPERSMGGAAWFGLVLISGSKLALVVAVVSYFAHWIFLSGVENPHMRKLYGEAALSRQGGVTKQLKGVATRNASLFNAATSHPAVAEVRGTLEKVQKDASSVLDEFVRESGNRFERMKEEGRKVWLRSKDRLLIVRSGDNVKTIDRSAYAVQVLDPPPSNESNGTVSSAAIPRSSTSRSSPVVRYHLGCPISVMWSVTAPTGHAKRDWVGIYLISRFGEPGSADREENRLVTRISSQGAWLPVVGDEEVVEQNRVDGLTAASAAAAVVDDDTEVNSSAGSDGGEMKNGSWAAGPTKGKVTFQSSHLPWKTGVYEARYHHDGKQDVLARSKPFEIYVDQPAGDLAPGSTSGSREPMGTTDVGSADPSVPSSIDSDLSILSRGTPSFVSSDPSSHPSYSTSVSVPSTTNVSVPVPSYEEVYRILSKLTLYALDSWSQQVPSTQRRRGTRSSSKSCVPLSKAEAGSSASESSLSSTAAAAAGGEERPYPPATGSAILTSSASVEDNDEGHEGHVDEDENEDDGGHEDEDGSSPLPNSTSDDFTIWDLTQAQRIARGMKEAFGVDFSTEVIVAEANVSRLAQDVVEARRLVGRRRG